MTAERLVAVLGAGSFGTALAHHIARNGFSVCLWARDEQLLQAIESERENRKYLPGIALAEALRFNSDLEQALANATDVLIAIPSQHFSATLEKIDAFAPKAGGVLWACKGLEADTGRFLSDVVVDKLGANRNHAVISGPTFASELASALPTAITVAANSKNYAETVVKFLHSDRFRTYISDDIRGVQLGGAFKNIYAIAAGISDGLNFGANARVAVITRGLAELMRLGETLGVQSETLMGLSGVGDLILTCTDDQSRNRRFGLALGKGQSVSSALNDIGQSVEGIIATDVAFNLAAKHNVSMPIVEQVQRVINNQITPAEAVNVLLGRASKSE